MPSIVVQALLATLVVTRFGILAAVAYTLFFLSSIWFPLTLDPNAFYITSSVMVTALLLGLGWCALYTTPRGKTAWRLDGEPIAVMTSERAGGLVFFERLHVDVRNLLP